MADLSSSALLTIDVQGDFYRPAAPALIEGTAERLPEMQRVVEAYRSAGRSIVHVVRLYLADGSNVEPVRRVLVATTPVVRPETPGSQLASELLPPGAGPLDPELLLGVSSRSWVRSSGSCTSLDGAPSTQTHLEEHLRALAVETVVVVGCNFPNCARMTLYEASERDFGIVLVSDAVSGIYEQGLTGC